MSDDRDDAKRELERLARGYRAPKQVAPYDPEPARQRLIAVSLGIPGLVFGLAAFVGVVGSLLAGIFVLMPLVGANAIGFLLLVASSFAALFGTIWLLVGPIANAFARRQHAWLEQLAKRVPFDPRAYVDLLGVERQFGSQMVFTIEMTHDSDPDAKALLVRAATRACRGTKAAWNGRALVVTGREVTTSSSGRGGTSYNNHALHRWFRRAARRFLIPAARAYGLARVQVEIR